VWLKLTACWRANWLLLLACGIVIAASLIGLDRVHTLTEQSEQNMALDAMRQDAMRAFSRDQDSAKNFQRLLEVQRLRTEAAHAERHIEATAYLPSNWLVFCIFVFLMLVNGWKVHYNAKATLAGGRQA
jgi:hypothetical protein